MAEVVVTVNGRAFPLTVADGEEPRIRRLASYVDGKVGEFVKMHGQIGEARLILLAALVVADELSDTNDLVQNSAQRRPQRWAGRVGGDGERHSRHRRAHRDHCGAPRNFLANRVASGAARCARPKYPGADSNL